MDKRRMRSVKKEEVAEDREEQAMWWIALSVQGIFALKLNKLHVLNKMP